MPVMRQSNSMRLGAGHLPFVFAGNRPELTYSVRFLLPQSSRSQLVVRAIGFALSQAESDAS